MKIRGQQVYEPQTRVLRKVIKTPSGCWEWNGSRAGRERLKQYGKLVVGSRQDGTRRTVRAHRYAYEVFVGPIPEGQNVMHKCDNPACVNPEHLALGTQKENVADCIQKGRFPFRLPAAPTEEQS